MQKTRFGCLIIAAILAASTIALNFTTIYTFAQNATSTKNTTAVDNMTGGTMSSSSCGSTESSCYDAGYQNALAKIKSDKNECDE